MEISSVFYICNRSRECKLTMDKTYSENGKAYLELHDDLGRPYLKEIKMN